MADPEEQDTSKPESGKGKRRMVPLVIGLVLAIAGGAGGFYGTFSGLLFGNAHAENAHPAEALDSAGDFPDIAFVPIEPIVVSVLAGGQQKHLRFRSQLEVPNGYEQEVMMLLPRVVDVLNGYLRALNFTDISKPSALVRIRAQMLRRIKTVLGRERINDLLIMEFVLD